jgi:two-component system OmpR family sensor kinase
MKSSIHFEMMYKINSISSKIISTAMKQKSVDRVEFLKGLNKSRFTIGYYDKNKNKIYSEIKKFKNFNKQYITIDNNNYAILKDESQHLGVYYIVIKDSSLLSQIEQVRLKIISYLLLSFIFMGIIGYFLSKLFLSPISQKIDALDRFISDTTHELNTPISAILMTISRLKGCDEKKIKRLEISSKRLSSIYNSLTYRLQTDIEDIEIISFSKLVEERVEYINELAKAKKITIDMDLEDLEIYIDRENAIRLIDNLLSNAIKYSDLDGYIKINIKDNILSVEDNGIGIEKSLQKDIFKRYNRGDRDRGGFGIGLDIVFSICKKYNIKILLESNVGVGSKFSFIFP